MLRWFQTTVPFLDGGGRTFAHIRLQFTVGVVHTPRAPKAVYIHSSPIRQSEGTFWSVRPFGPGITLTPRSLSRNLMIYLGSQRWSSKCSCPRFIASIPSVRCIHSTADDGVFSGHTMFQGPTASRMATSSMPDLPCGEHSPCPDPVTILGSMLSVGRTPATRVQECTIRIVRQLYSLIKERSQLDRLTGDQMSELASLAGSLSLPKPRLPCIFNSRTMLMDADRASGACWPFVLEIIHDKENMGRSLCNRDRYWAMRAYLAAINAQHETNSVAEQHSWELISRATAEYLKIDHIWDSEIHIPYFEVLLSWSPSMHLPEVVHRLCAILEMDLKPYPQFLDFLWKLLLKYNSDMGPSIQGRILSMVAARISKIKIISTDNHKEQRQIPVSIPQLASAVVSTIFPARRADIPDSFRQWSHEQCLLGFSPSLPVLDRWKNLLLISIYQAPQLSASLNAQPLLAPRSSHAIEWHTIFVLATLHEAINGESRTNPTMIREGQATARLLWTMWKNKGKASPTFATRPTIAAFLMLAAATVDKLLTDACFLYCTQHGLWTPERKDCLQTRDLIFSYILASAACRGRCWTEIFSSLRADLTVAGWECGALEDLIRYYTSKNPTIALELYRFGVAQAITIPANTFHTLSIVLASSPETIDSAIAFLQRPSPRDRLEGLFIAFLLTLHQQQHQRTTPIIASSLAKVMRKLYRTRPPPLNLKYPIRHFLPVMITSGQARQSIDILQAIHATSPEFFSVRYFRRLMHVLFRHRHFKLATRLPRFVGRVSPPSISHFRANLIYRLAKAGAKTLAKRVDTLKCRRRPPCSIKESLARRLHYDFRTPSGYMTLKAVPPLLRREPAYAPNVKHAVSILVSAKRILAARKLFAQTHQDLDPKSKTLIANIILHGYLHRPHSQNTRLVRHILRIKEFLETEYAAASDQVTVNIIIKALLQRPSFLDATRARTVFDHLVRCGYPAGGGTPAGVVPFGTRAVSIPGDLRLPALAPPTSFNKHIRPLYKTFIKAFYLRGDVQAAKTVVGILQDEAAIAAHELAKRNRARRLGVVHKARNGGVV